ncbi:MAG: DEAD/DEAH box helicase family protein [Erythrobacter sp.]
MELKQYQKGTLATLREFLTEARIEGPIEAFRTVTGEPEQAERMEGLLSPYRPLNGLADTPYVCLRLPTGGGKTILASHSVSVASESWMEKDYPLVLWLVPTTTIRKQTVEALKNPKHPYRAVLDDEFEGRVRVLDIADFGQLTPHDIKSNCCIIVGTIQTLRTSSTDGRKVYAHSEDLEPHFSALPRKIEGLETIEGGRKDGTIKFSFANLMHLHRPLMIVDEAHKAVTGLSQEMQRRVNPSAIIEFTATPHSNSNLLHSVSAQELKDEEMIKLPVMLAEHPTWQQAVDGAVAKRKELHDIAERDEKYIRPIVLFQAQDRNQEANVEVLKGYLVETGIEPNRIAIATGEQRELDDVNLFDPNCKIDFVITVEALKEGWDCSFAYVFCSLANIASSTDAEQLLGRVLRMPYAKEREDKRLNRAYAHLASKTFSAAAEALKDKLVAMGFSEIEAEKSIQSQQPGLDDGLFGRQARPRPSVSVPVKLKNEDVERVEGIAPEKVQIVTTAGKQSIKVTRTLTPQERERLSTDLPEDVADKVREAVARYEAEHEARISPAERGDAFVLPALMANVQGELELAETELLMEHSDWSLLDHSHQLQPSDFNLTATADAFEIDLDGRSLTIRSRDPSTQLSFDVEVEGWSEQGLVLFLAKQVREPDLSPSQLVEWLTKTVSHLHVSRDLPLAGLMQSKYILARKIRERIATIRNDERGKVYQASLFAPEAKPEISFDDGFEFRDGMFAGVRAYEGDFIFQKHFLGPDFVPAFDGKAGGAEEMCGRALDGLPSEVLKHWARNVSQHGDAFWLPLEGGKFFPDFVAELSDGRFAVIEYKGEPYATNDDSKAKVAIGELWERTSQGRGLFLMVEKEVDGLQPRDQLLKKFGA